MYTKIGRSHDLLAQQSKIPSSGQFFQLQTIAWNQMPECKIGVEQLREVARVDRVSSL